MMDQEPGDELEEEHPASPEPAERPSLSERLLGVTTMEDGGNTAYTSTSARGLIERLTAADRRPPERRSEPEAKRQTNDDKRARASEPRLKIDQIPAGLRVGDPAPAIPVNEDEPPAAETVAPAQDFHSIIEEPPPATQPRRPIVTNLPPVFENKRPVINTGPVLEDRPIVERATEGNPPVAAVPAPVAEDRTSIVESPAPATQDKPPAAEALVAVADAPVATMSTAADSVASSWESVPRLDNVPKVPAADELARMPLRVGPGPLESSLDEANNFIRLRYYVLLASIAFVFGLAIVSGIAMVAALVANAEWQVMAVTGALEALALLALVAILVFLQHEPSVHHAPTSTEIAQLETARAYLNKSFEFWEKYLNEREDSRPVTAEDVAMAVSSLTAASHSLLDLESGLAAMTPKPKEAVKEQPPVPGSTTRPSVRARPSRY